jgi:MFS family permease
VLASRLRARIKDSWLQAQMSVWSAAFIILAISDGQSLVYMGITMAALGFTGAISNIEFDTYLVKNVPENMLARVTSIERLVSFSACAIGPLAGGFLFEAYGARYGVQDTVRWLMFAAISLTICSVLMPSMRARGNRETTRVPRQAAQEASAWDMIIGWQLGSLASCLDALNFFVRDDREHGLPASSIAEPGPRAPERERVSSGQAST